MSLKELSFRTQLASILLSLLLLSGCGVLSTYLHFARGNTTLDVGGYYSATNSVVFPPDDHASN